MFTAPKWVDSSFFDEVDAICPPYEAPQISGATNGEGAVLSGDKDPVQRATVARAYDRLTGEPIRAEFTMPWQKYIRMLDPKGLIMPVSVATCQNAAEDASGHGPAMVQRKVAAGWLVCERGTPNMYGLDGENYGEFLRGEYVKRQTAEDIAYQKREDALITQAERAQAAAQEKQTEAIVAAVERGQQNGDLAQVLARLERLEAENASLRKRTKADQ